jgi:hypothetical protein
VNVSLIKVETLVENIIESCFTMDTDGYVDVLRETLAAAGHMPPRFWEVN